MDDNVIKKHIGNKIKEYRKKKNLTQQELGEKLNITHSAVSAYERGLVDLNLKTLYNLADIFEVNVDDLFPARKNQKDHFELTKGMYSKNLKVEEMLKLQEIFDKAASMTDEEREIYIRNLTLADDYHKKMSR